MKIDGRAAVVAPDNVLFEGGAGEKVRRNLLQKCCVHTLLRLPTGIWYSPGVKANVTFFDKKEGCAEVWTDKLWVYDLRTNQHFTLKQKPIQRSDFFSQTASYSDPHTADHAPGRIPDLNHTPEASRAHPRYLLTPFREREPHVAGPTGWHVCGGEGKSDPPGGPSLRVTAQAIRTAAHEREHLDLVDTLSGLGE